MVFKSKERLIFFVFKVCTYIGFQHFVFAFAQVLVTQCFCKVEYITVFCFNFYIFFFWVNTQGHV